MFDFTPYLEASKGIKLDVGCGDSKQPGFVGLDRRARPGVDIVHDVESFPWPIPDGICNMVLMSHLWEHIQPKFRIELVDEIWRIMKVGGQLWISSPYSTSFGAAQDPTHYPCPNQATFRYFDPDKDLYVIYKPKPWYLKSNVWHMNGNLEVVLEKREELKEVENA